MVPDKVNVLLLEDNAAEERLIRELLNVTSKYPRNYPEFEIDCTGYLHEGLARLEVDEIDVVLFNLGLRDSDQWDTVTALQAYAKQTPLIMLTGYDEETWGLRAVQAGVQDYLPKDEMSGRMLARSILYAIERHRLETELRQHRDQLEAQVAARTAELEETITQLHHEIAERQRAEQAWRESTAEFKVIFEMALSMICIADIEQLTFLRVNPAFTTILGYQEEELLAHSFLEFVHPDDVASTSAVVEEKLRQGTPLIHFTNRYRAKDGTYRWLDWNSHPWPEKGITFAIAHDITVQQLKTQELRESQETLHSFMNAMPQAAFLMDPTGLILAANSATAQRFGLDTADLLGQNIYDFLPPDVAEIRQGYVAQAVRTGEMVHFEDVRDTTYVDNYIQPLPDASGQVTRLVVLGVDITARKHMEEELRKSEKWHRLLLDSITDGCWVLDAEWRYTLINERGAQLVHMQPEQLVGHKLTTLFPDVVDTEFFAAYQRAMKEQTTERITAPFILPGGHERIYEVHVYPAPGGILCIGNDITARTKAEKELHASEKLFRTLFDNVRDGIFVHPILPNNQPGPFVQVNAAACAMLGYSPDEFSRMTPWELDDPDTSNDYIPQVMQHLRDRGLARFEAYQVAKDGRKVLVEVHANVCDIRGTPHIISVVRDITARKQAEEALRTSEERFAKVFHASPIAIGLGMLSSGRFLDLNERYAEFFGYSREELLGMSAVDLWVDHREREPIVKALQETGSVRNVEAKFHHKSGNIRLGLLSMEVISFTEFEEPVLLAMLLDTTERKQTEMALQESEERYRSLFANNHAVMLLIDPGTGAIVDANPAACTYYGYTWAELTCRTIDEINILTQAQVQEEMQRAVTETRRQFFFRHRLASGEVRDVEVYSGPIQVEGQRLLYSIIHDITARKQAEQQLKRSNADLQQFATTVSHDLQAPLRMVTSFLDLVKEHYSSNLNTKAQEYIDLAVTNAQQMSHLIQDLLQYSRLDVRGQAPAPTATASLVASVLQTLRLRIAGCGAEITHDSLPEVHVDATQVRQVFQNLLDNALKFRQPDVPPRIHIAVERQGNQWQFAVCDNGIGIAPEYHDHIFTIFQRGGVTEDYEGTGVGLAICQKIVERHGGRMWLESMEGQGATFYFTLPAVQETEAQSQAC